MSVVWTVLAFVVGFISGAGILYLRIRNAEERGRLVSITSATASFIAADRGKAIRWSRSVPSEDGNQ